MRLLGLSVHMSQVHKEQLTEVENALPNRAGLDVEIFGMEGIPDEVLHAHRQRVATQFHQAEAERQAATGNPPSGAGGNNQPSKKPKLESLSDMKKRLAEHRAKRAGASSGEATPVGAGQPMRQSVPATGSYVSYSQVYASAPVYAPTYAPTQQLTYYGQPQAAAAPAQQYSYPQPYGAPAAATTLPYPQTASPGYQPFSPASGQPVPGYPPAGYSPQPYPGQPSPFPQYQPTPAEATPHSRSGSLPAMAGLPQRPAVGAPAVNAQQMHQYHMGHPTPATGPANGEAKQAPGQASPSGNGATTGATTETPKTEEKPSKKEKAKTRLVYSDETLSPEEKMAQLPRYAFTRDRVTTDTVIGELPGSVVVGAIRDSDTVFDPAQ